jgi:hypothetical protein
MILFLLFSYIKLFVLYIIPRFQYFYKKLSLLKLFFEVSYIVFFKAFYGILGIFDTDKLRNFIYSGQGFGENTFQINTINWCSIYFQLLFYIQNIIFVLIGESVSGKHGEKMPLQLTKLIFPLFIIISFPIAVVFQLFYEILEARGSNDRGFDCLKSCRKYSEENNLNKWLYANKIYISGMSEDLLESIDCLDEYYNLRSYYYLEGEEVEGGNELENKENLIRMMGANLFIYFYNKSENQNFTSYFEKEIETARRLRKRILFVYNSEKELKNDDRQLRKKETKIIFDNLEETLQLKYGLIKNIKKKENVSFKRIKSITKNILNVKYETISNVCLLKKNQEQSLIYFGQNENQQESFYKQNIQNYVPENVDFNLNINKKFIICINNFKFEIIVFDNIEKTLDVYDSDFKLNKRWCYKNKMNQFDFVDDLKVNESNDNIYGIIRRFNTGEELVLTHFSENLGIEKKCLSYTRCVVSLKLFRNQLYVFFNNTTTYSDFPFIYVYENNLKFTKEIQIDKSISSHNSSELSKDYIFLTGYYRNHYNLVNKQCNLFFINYEGKLMRKINLTCNGLTIDNIFDFFIIDENLIYFLTNGSKANVMKVEFSNSTDQNNNFSEKALNDESIPFIDYDEENGEA